jgi:uncharacterized RDD family membrane protein YckC
MPNALRFETPENVQVQYEPAGLGTRFVAWFIDQIIVWACMVGMLIALLAAGASFEFVFHDNGRKEGEEMLYFVGLMMLVWGLGSFVYFGCCELFMRGQTVGKRISNIRVIKSNGFQLDPGSILIRNLFRVADHIPPMWLFPIISKTSQRAGDMVAGTLVVFDHPVNLSSVRSVLGTRKAADAQFRFDASALKRLTSNDFLAVEQVLERLSTMPPEDRHHLLQLYSGQIAKKLSIEPPTIETRQQFLEDLFAAELRRQDRSLG